MLHVFAYHCKIPLHIFACHYVFSFPYFFSCPDKMIFLEDLFVFDMLGYLGISRLYLCIEDVVFG